MVNFSKTTIFFLLLCVTTQAFGMQTSQNKGYFASLITNYPATSAFAASGLSFGLAIHAANNMVGSQLINKRLHAINQLAQEYRAKEMHNKTYLKDADEARTIHNYCQDVEKMSYVQALSTARQYHNLSKIRADGERSRRYFQALSFAGIGFGALGLWFGFKNAAQNIRTK